MPHGYQLFFLSDFLLKSQHPEHHSQDITLFSLRFLIMGSLEKMEPGSRNTAGRGPYDDSCWVHKTIHLSMTPLVRLHYISAKYPTAPQRGTIVLLHGFPQTSYQYRYVITPLAKAGYHVICPDTRGAGASSHPPSGYSKSELAGDLRILLYDHEKIQGKVHVVGQDIGGMLAHAFAARFPEHIATVSIGECPLPGTEPFEASKHSPLLYHFDFQTVPDLPELLISGRERIYLKHFYDRAAYNPQAISQHDIDVYAESYSQPGAMRCGFELYRTFEEDSQYNRKIVRTRGKNKVAVMALYGEFSFCAEYVKQMLEEVYVGPVEVGMVRNASHWTTEENPDEFVDKVLGFIGKHKTNVSEEEKTGEGSNSILNCKARL